MLVDQVASFFLVFAVVGVLVGTSFFLIRGLFLNNRNYSRSDALDMLAKIILFVGGSLLIGLASYLITLPFYVWHLLNGILSFKLFGEWMSVRFEYKRIVFLVYMIGLFTVSTLISFTLDLSLTRDVSFVFTHAYPLLKVLLLSFSQTLESFLSFLAWLVGLRFAIRGEL